MSEVTVSKGKAIQSLQDMRTAAAEKLSQAEELQATIDAEDREWTPEEEADRKSVV